MEHPVIAINDLSFGYSKKIELFTHLNLSLEKGGIYGLLGKNGAGKTSLLKILAGLIFPNQGNCQVMGQIPQQRHPEFLANLYFLAEDLFVPALTADDYVKFYAPFYPQFNYESLYSCLNEFDLPRNQLLTKFSYGQKKKFLIAFGLATNSQLLILDEPTNGLDIPSKTQFRKLLAAMVTAEKSVIISTHQVHDVENLIDSIVILDDGKIIFQQNLVEIAKKLSFVRQREVDPNSCLYYEKKLDGYIAIVANENNQDTYIDLEVLFNAILANKNQIQQSFTRG